jgi:hypothetical protein
MTVVTPTEGIDPRAALASSIHASPGVFAVLLGSGISTAAGVPTGWEVVQRLIRRVAKMEDVDLDQTGQSPDEWYAGAFGCEARYDKLLGQLAPTDRLRRDILRRYFEVSEGTETPLEPTTAHRVIAKLCAQGRVRVILTTNFDHLMEHALDEAGAASQVLVSPNDRKGMTPLQHAATTLVKLHGDYRGRMRNTTAELAKYPRDLAKLVDEVFDRYGLIIVGWSTEYDVALAQHLSAARSRRYPTYWLDYKNSATEEARRLIVKRGAAVIAPESADEFFLDLEQRIGRLDKIAMRRQQPTALWDHHHAPTYDQAPTGWTECPLLQLRAVCELEGVRRDDCGPIGPDEREALLSALGAAPVSKRVSELTHKHAAVPAFASPEPGSLAIRPEDMRWLPTPGGNQSTAFATYRLGGDASTGMSALFDLWLPRAGGGSVLITIDIAISSSGGILPIEAALIWQDALVALSGPVPDAIRGILPLYAEVTLLEIHAGSAEWSSFTHRQTGGLWKQLNLDAFGPTPDGMPASIGQAMRTQAR